MKIKDLNMRCGKCSIMDFCDEPWSDICICCDKRFTNVKTDSFIKVAENSVGCGEVLLRNVYKKLEEENEKL